MFAYTQGPGGVRRGPIWQSSNLTPSRIDNRYHLFTPWREGSSSLFSEIEGNAINTKNGLPTAYAWGGATGFKIPTNQPTLINCPYYIYIPSTAQDSHGDYFLTSFGDEMSYYEDIDIYLSPVIMKQGSNTDFDDPVIELNNQTYTLTNYAQEITNAPKAFAKGYYTKSQGEIFDEPTASAVKAFLESQRIAYPSCPMRIQMRIVYSDYPFALSAAYTGGASSARAIEFPFESCKDYFTGILDQYVMPSDNDFNGSGISSRNGGAYYDDFSFPAFQVESGARKSKYSSTTAQNKFYRYTEGALYNGLQKSLQMYISPLMYPMVRNTDGGTNDNYDYYMLLPSYASDVNTNRFKAHAHPYMLPPVVSTPRISEIRYYSGVADPRYNPITLKFASGNFTSNDNNSPFMATGDLAAFSFVQGSTLGAKGVSRSTSSSDYTTPTWPHFTNPQGITGNAIDHISGYMQPKIIKGQKYIQEFRVVCVKGDTHVYTGQSETSNNGAFSGRYKFLGFKGKISFFETEST